MLGNVLEWTASCWNASHAGAPAQQPAFDPDALLRSLRPTPQQAQQRQQQAAATPGTGDGRAPNAPLDPLRPLSSEEVEDKWVKNPGAPADGRARQGGDCSRRVLRGGSWLNLPVSSRSANRDWFTTGGRLDNVGFRVARTL
jgi:formylglycine-generating enzyme required for sulfatase activity